MGTKVPPPVQVKTKLTNLYEFGADAAILLKTFSPVMYPCIENENGVGLESEYSDRSKVEA